MERGTRLTMNRFSSGRTHQFLQTNLKFGDFELPNIPLGTADRRLLSSTIESFLSKDEESTLITTCFFRDVLLADFPPETFIQESSLSQSLLQVVKESWEDPMVNYVGFQALMRLASSLRSNIGTLDSSEFYQQNVSLLESLQLSSRSHEQDYSSTGSYSERVASRASEYFLNNYFQLLSGLSRALTYKPANTHLWLLLESYSSLLHQYLTLFSPGNIKSFYLSIEEVLLDLSQCFLRNVGLVNPCLVATIMSSLLSNFDESGNIVLTSDVRRAIWALASNTKLSKSPFVRNYFIQKALHFEHDLKKTSDLNGNDNSVEIFRSASWWKLDVINEQREWRDTRQESSKVETETEIIPKILYGIQNAVEHGGVVDGVDQLWQNLTPLVFNKVLPESVDSQLVPPNCQWRESFYRFLSVEPTSAEDEALLIRILDFSTFLLHSMRNSERLRDWVVPLVSEKNSALLRLFLQESSQCIESTSSTTFSTISYSVVDFYLAILNEGTNSNQLGEFFNVCAETLKALYDTKFPSTVVFLAVLKSMAHLVSLDFIQEKLKETKEVCVALTEIVANGIHILCEKMTEGSNLNFGAFKYGGTILAHLSNILVKEAVASIAWVRSCASIVPLLWVLDNVFIKTSAIQICANITASERGTLALITELESPTFLWRFTYTRLTDLAEASIVKQRAAKVLLNLMTNWNQMKHVLGPQLEIPRLKLLEEITSVLSNVCWHPRISKLGRNGGDSKLRFSNEETDDPSGDNAKTVSFITPNVLSHCAMMIGKIIQNSEAEKWLISENGPLPRDTCVALSRVLGSFKEQEALEGDDIWWQQSLVSIGNATHALITIVELDRTLPLVLIADRQNLSNLISYFSIICERKSKSEEMLSVLWRNMFILLSTILDHSGQNFEDLERLIKNHRKVIFPRLIEWLDIKTPSAYRKSAVDFVSTLLRLTYGRGAEGTVTGFLCHVWTEPDETYGIAICKKLLGIVDHSGESDERCAVLHCLNYLCLLSVTAKTYAIQEHIVKKVVRGLCELGIKAVDFQCNNKKNARAQDEIKWLLAVLTTLFYDNQDTKEEALVSHFPDAFHTVFKFIKTLPDPTLLHASMNCLINFTADFPEGSHSLTLTTGMIGVTSRKMASPNSLYLEFVGMLQSELELVERNPNLNMMGMELLFSFVKNTSFSTDCRNLLVKGKVVNFLTRFHQTEMRKWVPKYPSLKIMFLNTLVQLTVYQDIQLCLSKIPESVEILIALVQNEPPPYSLQALQILRNLSFHTGNRLRLLHEPQFLSTLVVGLSESDNLDKLKVVGVTLWAITANSQKGKVVAKQAGCTKALNNTIQRLLTKQHSLPAEAPSLSALSEVISLLEKVSTVQNSNNSNDG